MINAKQTNCSGQSKKVRQEVFAKTQQDVLEIVARARIEGFKIHPVSTGNNWGYGSRLPYDENACILNLSEMNRISDFKPELRTIRIEPGVTQAQLARFLSSQAQKFLTPTTGAGEQASLLGNTLERGYGLAPWTDHFLSLTSLEVVLPDGSLHRSFYDEIGCRDIASVYKWGLGSYVDGLFSQAANGIVISATLCLQPFPERVSIVVAGAESQWGMLKAMTEIKELMSQSGGILAGVNYINSLRTASMIRGSSSRAISEKRAMSLGEIQEMESDLGLTQWNLVLTCYGSTEMAKVLERRLKSRLGFLKRRPRVFDGIKIEMIDRFVDWFPVIRRLKLFAQYEKVRGAYRLFCGEPQDLAHLLTKWRVPKDQFRSGLDLDASHAGLIWYAPIVPLTIKHVASAISMMEKVTRAYGFDPLITLTATNDRYAVATLALCFSRETDEETLRAQECYSALCMEGRSIGIFPYRIGTLETGLSGMDGFELQKKIKQTIDPEGILDPGRFPAVHHRAY